MIISYKIKLLNYGEAVTMSKTPQFMLLGTYHLNNPGLDKFNMQTDDVLSPKRQSELQMMIRKLAKYKPTKIALEVDCQQQERLNSLYSDYLVADGVTEKRSEQFQIGFRLARYLGHDKLFAVDVPGSMDIDAIINYSLEHGPADYAEKLHAIGNMAMQEFAERQQKSTIIEMLMWFNQPDMLRRNHAFYMETLRVGQFPDYIGVELVANWYARNFKIFNELMAIAMPEDRVLFLFGQGHIPIIKQVIHDSDFAGFVSPLDFL